MSSPTAETLAARLRWTLVAMSVLLTVAAGLVWAFGDAAISHHLSGLWWVQQHRRFLRWLTDAGLWPFYAIFLALLLAGWRRRQNVGRTVAQAYLVAELGGAFLAVRLGKLAFARVRPDALADEAPATWWQRLHDSDFHSFPSGHTTDVFTGAICLCLLLPKPWMRAYALAYATLIGLTRVLLAKHWPTDVIAGAVLATVFSSVALHGIALRRTTRAPYPDQG